jgi:hypothetical protein
MMGCRRNRSMKKRIMGIGLAFVHGTLPTIFFLFAATLLCVLAGDGNAADWQFNPVVGLGALSNDNYRLNSPGQRQWVNGLETDMQAQLRAVTDLTEFRLRPGVHATYFPDNHNQDETDSFLNINWNQNGQSYQGDPSIEDPNAFVVAVVYQPYRDRK